MGREEEWVDPFSVGRVCGCSWTDVRDGMVLKSDSHCSIHGNPSAGEQLSLFEVEECCTCRTVVDIEGPSEDCPEHGRCPWTCEISGLRCILEAARSHDTHIANCCPGAHT